VKQSLYHGIGRWALFFIPESRKSVQYMRIRSSIFIDVA
jgi:hypothetical protein